MDNAVPSGNSLATELLARMATMTGDMEYQRRASQIVDQMSEPMARQPLAFGHLLQAADMLVNGATEVAIVGDSTDSRFHRLAAAASTSFIPALVFAGGNDLSGSIAILRDRAPKDGAPTAYVCRGSTCSAPVTEAQHLAQELRPSASF
jgi:uncharacterized protein YyaL (SSP411 family)